MKVIWDIMFILAGIYITLVGFRVISASKKIGEEYEEWYKKWGGKLKIIGPILVIIGILMMFF